MNAGRGGRGLTPSQAVTLPEPKPRVRAGTFPSPKELRVRLIPLLQEEPSQPRGAASGWTRHASSVKRHPTPSHANTGERYGSEDKNIKCFICPLTCGGWRKCK
ncbi:hypothetical protein NDU88_006807 [Pleurodeles waltl]|uniref:Uncharacterized protein n=1 Tax=Pleurodeles waltl TaxID=8319 RepID=A0AAV7TY64_PLEWA|nr:hypothetical protein NDU88_006807 [Pleurodeles waltl]